MSYSTRTTLSDWTLRVSRFGRKDESMTPTSRPTSALTSSAMHATTSTTLTPRQEQHC
eukprot:gene8881-1232_t